jgi:outer membrane immunogenic protein
MKRIAIALLAGVAAALSLSQGALAADMPVKAAPPPPPVPSWTGFYIGVHAGAAWQSDPNWTYTNPNAGFFPSQGLLSDDKEGGVGGIQGGYNWQFAPNWLVGAEADISWASLADNRSTALLGPNLLAPVGCVTGGVNGCSTQMSANTEWLASVRGKFGFIGWNTLWYVTGGGAWANIEYSALTTAGFVGLTPIQANTSFTTTRSGWVAGAGAEWMATPNVLLRVEYLYYNFDNSVNAQAVFGPGTAFTALSHNWDKYHVQVARVGLSYKFDWLGGGRLY